MKRVSMKRKENAWKSVMQKSSPCHFISTGVTPTAAATTTRENVLARVKEIVTVFILVESNTGTGESITYAF